jgi:predicted TPR repeat methyltransferase
VVPPFAHLAVILRRLQRDDEALEVYRTWLEHHPGDPIATHMLRSMTGGESPDRASDEYVRAEFDDFAANFDHNLVRLEYRAPQLVVEALSRVRAAASPPAVVLDAGCGTGLCGPLLRQLARTLVGVDLSAGMLAVARDRDVYDDLVQAELTAYAEAHAGAYDVIVAADVLIYFGALEQALRALHRALRPGGTLAFSVECGSDHARGWTLLSSGRYAHHDGYLRRTLAATGLTVRALERARLRTELAAEVSGWIVVASR